MNSTGSGGVVGVAASVGVGGPSATTGGGDSARCCDAPSPGLVTRYSTMNYSGFWSATTTRSTAKRCSRRIQCRATRELIPRRIIELVHLAPWFVADEDNLQSPGIELDEVGTCDLHVCNVVEHSEMMHRRLSFEASGWRPVDEVDDHHECLFLEPLGISTVINSDLAVPMMVWFWRPTTPF